MHEVISFCTLSIIGTQWIIDVKKNKKNMKQIVRHVGLGIGYIVGFFAPGNQHRMLQSHDLITDTYVHRLKLSIAIHKSVLDFNIIGKCILYIGAFL